MQSCSEGVSTSKRDPGPLNTVIHVKKRPLGDNKVEGPGTSGKALKKDGSFTQMRPWPAASNPLIATTPQPAPSTAKYPNFSIM